MSLKDQILNRIKSISDPKLLRELDAWIRQAEEGKHEQVNEPGGTYHTEGTVKKRDKTASQKKGSLITNQILRSTTSKKLQKRAELKESSTRLNGRRKNGRIVH